VPGNQMVSAHVVLAKHAAERWTDQASRRADRWARTFDVRIARTVPRSAFVPRPIVDVVVLHLERRR